MPLSSHRQFDQALAFAAESVERTMDRLLPSGDEGEARLFEAMRYASLGGGKRLRAFFVLAGATLFKVVGAAGAADRRAIEFVHAYSLIHDDLPAMDDDDLRRGKPSCHKAIRRGDGDPGRRRAAGAGLRGAGRMTTRMAIRRCAASWSPSSRAPSGAHGMVGGQMIDLLAEQQAADRRSAPSPACSG